MSRRGRGRPRHSSHDEIRDIARELFLRQGYRQTSLQQIADAAGISRTTLFHYFPAKRDLMADEYDNSLVRLRRVLVHDGDAPAVRVMGDAIIAALSFSRQEHDALAARWRIVRDDDDLRADVALRTRVIAEELTGYAARRTPAAGPERVPDVVEALMAVVLAATTRWADQGHPGVDLDVYVAESIEPFLSALTPLLE
ncbi:MAG: TetR/AcrR family transcriptional regulator [Microbacterium sp.]